MSLRTFSSRVNSCGTSCSTSPLFPLRLFCLFFHLSSVHCSSFPFLFCKALYGFSHSDKGSTGGAEVLINCMIVATHHHSLSYSILSIMASVLMVPAFLQFVSPVMCMKSTTFALNAWEIPLLAPGWSSRGIEMDSMQLTRYVIIPRLTVCTSTPAKILVMSGT